MDREVRTSFPRMIALCATALLIACGGGSDATGTPPDSLAAEGSASTLDIANWNLEWFGAAGNGPADENLQLQNVRAVIAAVDFDVWGLAEVVSDAQFNSLKAQLSGYDGFTADAASVTNGAAFYGASEQKLAVLYKKALATLTAARIILTENDNDFAGRPPLEVKLRINLNGRTQDLVVIVLHMKAFSDSASWQRRVAAGAALKSYLDATYPTQQVAVIGDWNDDVDASISAGRASPYQSFFSDGARYTFPTAALSAAKLASTVGNAEFIDHQLNTNELAATYVAGSAKVYRADARIHNYSATTSDHYAVLARYNF